MTDEELLREISALPPEAQHEVEEFIAFLRQRYQQPQPNTPPESSDWHAESFVGMWRDREEMRDSSAWVRGVRESEWVK